MFDIYSIFIYTKEGIPVIMVWKVVHVPVKSIWRKSKYLSFFLFCIRLPCASEVTRHMRLSINVRQKKTGFVRSCNIAFTIFFYRFYNICNPLLCTCIVLALKAEGCADWTAALQPHTQQSDSDTIEFLSHPSSINLIMGNTVIHVWWTLFIFTWPLQTRNIKVVVLEIL